MSCGEHKVRMIPTRAKVAKNGSNLRYEVHKVVFIISYKILYNKHSCICVYFKYTMRKKVDPLF